MICEKTIDTPQRIEKIDKWQCDVCGMDMDTAFADRIHEVLLYELMGCVYPDVDTRTGKQLDVCPCCMIEKVMPCIEKEFCITARSTTNPISW